MSNSRSLNWIQQAKRTPRLVYICTYSHVTLLLLGREIWHARRLGRTSTYARVFSHGMACILIWHSRNPNRWTR